MIVRLVLYSEDEIADLNNLSEDEKTNGISSSEPHYVLYDKGDKDGNKWYLKTPFYINWSKENVKFLKDNAGKKEKVVPDIKIRNFTSETVSVGQM